jgi:hypothetical protein
LPLIIVKEVEQSPLQPGRKPVGIQHDGIDFAKQPVGLSEVSFKQFARSGNCVDVLRNEALNSCDVIALKGQTEGGVPGRFEKVRSFLPSAPESHAFSPV